MGIGTLDLGEAVGNYRSTLFNIIDIFVNCQILIVTHFVNKISAIGAIFAATDSVCTLQVCNNNLYSLYVPEQL